MLAGGRRLAAAQSLGWTQIEAKVAHGLDDAATWLRAERDENTCRKGFTLTEEHSLYEALLALQEPAGSDSPGTHAAPSTWVAGIRGPSSVSARERRFAAEIASGSPGRHKTLEKVGEVKRIAQDSARSERVRQKAQEALDEMDQTESVAGPYTKVMLAVRAEDSRRSSDIATWSDDEQQLLHELRAGRTVVVSLREHHARTVRWAEAEGRLMPVDRRTEWGNPWEIPHDGDRETVIRNYADHYLPCKPSLLARLPELRGKALACWCAPESCHAEVLKRQAESVD